MAPDPGLSATPKTHAGAAPHEHELAGRSRAGSAQADSSHQQQQQQQQQQLLNSTCQAALHKAPGTRSTQDLLQLAQLLVRCKLYSGLCSPALTCLAQHARLLVLDAALELPGPHEAEEPQQIYVVVSGVVTLLHGEATDPALQQLLAACRAQPPTKGHNQPPSLEGSSLALSTIEAGDSFCVFKFTCASPSADELLATKLPTSCLAAVASRGCAAAAVLVAVSKPLYTEALRVHQEAHVSQAVSSMCRLPCLRHAPLKELTRLAAHTRRATFSKGQVISQGRESDIHFVLQGTVQVTYTAALSPAEAAAAGATGRRSDGGSLLDPPEHGCNSGGVRAPAAGRFSGLAGALGRPAEQACLAPPVVLGTRGPGSVLGDDGIRDRRLAVGVVAAEDGVVTLRVSPQRFLALLDPLTLRLFGRLRQQQEQALQDMLVAAGSYCQPDSEAALRHVLLQPGQAVQASTAEGGGSAAVHQQHRRPDWRSVRSKDTTAGHKRSPGAATACSAADADAAWEARLPVGMTANHCVGLPASSVSVRQLVEVIKDTSEFRRLHSRTVAPSAAAASAVAAAAATNRAASASVAGAPAAASAGSMGPNLLLGLAAAAASRSYGGAASSSTAAVAGAAAAAAATLVAGSDGGNGSSSCRTTELLEACCVAVLEVQVLPGQPPVGLAALAGTLDAVTSAWGAVVYDEALQLVRWGPTSFILLAPTEPGSTDGQCAEVAADVLLSAAGRMAGVWLRAEAELPCVRLAAGLAHGSCFAQCEAGNFISSVSGRAFSAAQQLCEAAMQLPPGSLPGWPLGADSGSSSSSSSSMNSTQPVMLVTDAVSSLLQGSHVLQPLPGGHLLLAANALLPTSPATAHGSRAGSRPGTASGSRTTQALLTSRATLGPGRHTVWGLGPPGMPMSPKTPGSRRAGGPQRNTLAAGRAHARRKIRRKFEEMASFLAGAGDLLPPPPEHLLTQPPAACGDGVWTAAAAHAASAAGAAPASRARVNFAVGEAAAAGAAGSAGTQKAPRPKLTVSLDGASGEDESASQLVWPSSTRAVAAAAAPRPASPQMVQQHATPVHAHHVVQASSSGSAAAGSRPHALSGRPGSGAKATQQVGSVQQHAKGSASGSTVSARGLASAAATAQAGSSSAGAGSAQHATSGSTAGAARSSGLQARQQVWREVEALRSGAGIAPQPVTGSRPASPFLLPLVSQARLTSSEYAEAAGGSSEPRRPPSPLHAAARHAVDGILAEHGCKQSPSQAQERVMQQCLVLSASKALGSVAAAEAYVAALPAGQRAVHLSSAGLTQLPSLHGLPQLKILAASFNKLHVLSASSLPPSLRVIFLAFNRLVSLPAELPAALPELRSCDLSHNALSELPQALGELACLTWLAVSHNQLHELPGSITRLQQLHTLHGDHNQLACLPQGLHQLSGLQHLHAGHNQLSGLGQLPQGLKSLRLSFNQLQELPAGWLSRYSALTHLDLAGTGLTDAMLDKAAMNAAAGAEQQQPEATGALVQLRDLCVSHNHLTQLPSWLPAGLAVLSASHNQIREVSPTLCERLAGSLQLLFLQGNRLLQLPPELKLLSELQLLALAGNPGLSPDAVQEDGLAWAGSWLTAQKAASAATALRSAVTLLHECEGALT